MNSELAIAVNNLSKVYKSSSDTDKLALDNISLAIKKGSIFGLLGPNGAGKSTFINILADLAKKTSGEIEVLNINHESNLIEAKRLMGIVPQELNIDPFFTPYELLEIQAGLYGIKKKDRKTMEILKMLALEDKAKAYARTLSGGMRRRLLIAKAMVHDPEILILDEPTDGLDPNQKHEIRALIKEMAAEKAILISTHILEEVESVCTKAIIISNGGVIFSGSPLELSSKSRYHNAITLVINNKDVKKSTKILEELEEVRTIERISEAELTRVTLIPQSSEVEISSLVKAKMADYECEILQLYIEPGRLDEVFRSLTNQHKSGEVIRS